MHEALHSKQTEIDREQKTPAQKPTSTKQRIQRVADATRMPLFTQVWGNQPPPWLRLPTSQHQTPHEQPLQRQVNEELQDEVPGVEAQLGSATRPSHDLGGTNVRGNTAPMIIQPKLTIGPAHDQYEQEADRIAEQVMRTSVTSTDQQAIERNKKSDDEQERLQTKPLAMMITPLLQRETNAEDEEEEELQTKPTLQRATVDDDFEASTDIANRIAASKGGGHSLPDSLRAFMEPRFGVDFSEVRLHTGSETSQLNCAMGAQAFTHGQDIYLGEGKADFTSNEGKQLLAHELTHTLQQGAVSLKRWGVPRRVDGQGGSHHDDPDLGSKTATSLRLTALPLQDRTVSATSSSDTLIQRKLPTGADLEKETNYKGGKVFKRTWHNLTEALTEYDKLNPYSDDASDKVKRGELIAAIKGYIRKWQENKRHQKQLPLVITALDNLYFQCTVEELMLKPNITHIGGGAYVGSVPGLQYPSRGRTDKILGSQGYKLHISFDVHDVDKVLRYVFPQLESRKVISNPKLLSGTQENKLMAVYPPLTKLTFNDVKPFKGSEKKVTVTYYEANFEAAKELADTIAKLLEDADVKPGGPVPNEESLNPWIYTRYGSFTSKTIYEVKEGVLEEKSDLERG